MKPIKQRGQNYVGLDVRLESVLDALLYHPWNRRRIQKKYKKGQYLRCFQHLRGPTRKKFGSMEDLTIHACGVSHLDAAWLYPVVDTKERAYKTFYKALEHIEEFPFFTFAQTAPQYFDWIRCYDPKLWARIKIAVKSGRLELMGGMWIEPDLDLSSGEALVRQRLYGQLFFLREFGFFPTVESLLDSFGFPWSLPQILVKSGAKAFWTTKCAGSTPPAYFYWQGLDGSRIFTHQFTYNWDALQSTQSYRKKARFAAVGQNGAIISSHMSMQEIESKFSKVPGYYIHHLPFFYGIGDGGRGPLELEIMFADSLLQMHKGEHNSQHAIINQMQAIVGDRCLVWNDEMFLNMHHGTKTTQNAVKHWHRRAEMWASASESLITLLNLIMPKVLAIPKEDIFEMWRLLLFNEFHDILPGSSIPDVYPLAIQELQKSVSMAQALIAKGLALIPCSKEEIVVYNPFNWSRSEYVRENEQLYYFHNIPPLSIQIRSRASSLVTIGGDTPISNKKGVMILENSYLKAEIDAASGALVSLIQKATGQTKSQTNNQTNDRATGRELIKKDNKGQKLTAGLRVFKDRPRSRWKAWDIDRMYALYKIPIQKEGETKLISMASMAPSIETTYRFLKSTATVRFSLLPHQKMLHLQIRTDLQDPQLLVKYFLPLEFNSEDIITEIPYGVIPRKRIKRTELEKNKWETAMQKWIDLSDGADGLCIVNENRYGYSATKLGIYLTLTRTAEYPGISPLFGSTRLIPPKERPKFTDMMPSESNFGLYPHAGIWSEAHCWQEAYNFNLPLIVQQNTAEIQEGAKNRILPETFTTPIFQLNSSNILLGAFKLSEWNGPTFSELPTHQEWQWNGKSVIIRLVEIEGRKCTCSFTGSDLLKMKSVMEVDLLEMNPIPIPLVDLQHIMLPFEPFEIKTLRINF